MAGQTLLFNLEQLGLQHLERFFLVLQLAALILAGYHNAGRHMRHTNGTACLVDMLAPCAAGPVSVDFQVCFLDFNCHIAGFRQHCNRGCGRMYPAAALGHRYALYTVHTAFIAQQAESTTAVDFHYSFLDAAQSGILAVDERC